MRALVLALNPSIDVEWRVSQVRWEEKNQIVAERRWPGGKGVNVARWLRHLGAQPRLLLPLGGNTGKELAAGLRREGLTATVVPLRDATRANIIVTTERQGQLRFNPLGPNLSRLNWQAILSSARRELARADLMILSGSLPRGVAVDAYAQLIKLGHRAGVRTILDCDGPALNAALPTRPFLVKPNVEELASWCGRTLNSMAAVKKAGEALSRVTGGHVLVSRGARGALLIETGTKLCFTIAAPRVQVRNTVGAGDALLAAVAIEIMAGAAPEIWLRHGVATGSAATACVAGELPARALIVQLAAKIRAARGASPGRPINRENSGIAAPPENRARESKQ